MSRKIVHVVGTGTIGEPLIGLLCDFKDQLGIDEITFHKNTPLTTDRSKVQNLIKKRGARLTTHEEKFDGFNDIGFNSVYLSLPVRVPSITDNQKLWFLTFILKLKVTKIPIQLLLLSKWGRQRLRPVRAARE